MNAVSFGVTSDQNTGTVDYFRHNQYNLLKIRQWLMSDTFVFHNLHDGQKKYYYIIGYMC